MKGSCMSSPCIRALFFLLFIAVSSISQTVEAQDNSVTIGGTEIKSDAVLYLIANGDQGLILPAVDNVNAFTPSEPGMVAFNRADNRVYYFDGSAWVGVGGGSSGGGDAYSLRLQGANLELLINGGVQDQISLVDFTVGGDLTGNIQAASVVALNGESLPGGSPSTNQILVYDGANWTYQALPTGTFTGVVSDATLTGTGVSGDPLSVASVDDADADPNNELLTGATLNGSDLELTDAGGTTVVDLSTLSSGTLTAGAGINITGGVISNTGDLDDSDDVVVLTDLTDVNATSPSSGQVLQYNGSQWQPTTLAASTGDITDVIAGTGLTGGGTTGSVTLNLSTTGVTAGTYPKVTVNAQGRVTGGANLIAADIPNLTLSKITDAGALASLAAVSGGAGGTITDVSITNDDISNTANINVQKLDFSGTTDGDVLQIAGGVPVWSAAGGSNDAQSLQGTAIDPGLATPADGEVLKWNNANSRWEAAPDDVGGGGAPTLSDGQIIVGNGASNSAAGVNGDLTMSGSANYQIVADAVTTTEIGTAGISDADKVLTTDISGNPQWELKSSFVSGLDTDPSNEFNTDFRVNAGNLEVVDGGGVLQVPLTSIDTDDQTAAEVSVTASGNLTSTDVQSALVELQGDIDGAVDTDDQQIDQLSLSGTTLEVSLQDDGVAPVTLDLSSINTDAQTAAGVPVTASGNLTSTDVQSALVELQGDIDGALDTDDQQIDQLSLSGTTLEVSLQDDGIAPVTLDLSSINTDAQTATDVPYDGSSSGLVGGAIGTTQAAIDELAALPSGASNLSGLTDANVASPADGQILVYDGTTDNQFENVAISGDISMAADGSSTIQSSAGDNIIAAINNATTTQAVNINRINPPGGTDKGFLTTDGTTNTWLTTAAPNRVFGTDQANALTARTVALSTSAAVDNIGVRAAGTASDANLVSEAAVREAIDAVAGGWGLTGNAGTVDGTNFIGTTDNIPLTFRVGNVQSGRIEFNNLNANTFFGYSSGSSNSGDFNTGIGWSALQANTGHSNTAVGSYSLLNNGTGFANTVVGRDAMRFNTGGSANTAIGVTSLYQNTSGNSNTAVGGSAMNSNTTGFENVAVGNQALQNNTVGNNNTATGFYALINNIANNNTATGHRALSENTTGTGNTALGYYAGYTTTFANANTTGSNNTYIGYNSGPGTTTQYSNATAIGANARVNASNAMVLGGTGASAVSVGIGTAAPGATLDIIGDIKITDGTEAAGRVLTSDANGLATWQVAPGGGSLQSAYDGGNNINMTTSNNIEIRTSSPETALFIEENTGNVGIGTNTPSGGFEAYGDSGFPGLRVDATDVYVGDYGGNQFGNYLYVDSEGAGNFQFLGGDVGIGTASAEHLLHLSSTVTASSNDGVFIDIENRFGLNTSSAMTGLRFKNGNSGAGQNFKGGIFYRRNTTNGRGDIVFLNNNVDDGSSVDFTTDTRMVISNAGQVGIGTSTPTALLTVGNGNEFQVDDVGNLVRINNVAYDWPLANGTGVLTNDGAGTLSWSPGAGSLWTDASPDISYTTGNVGIGINSPNSRLDVLASSPSGTAATLTNSVSGVSGSALEVVNQGNRTIGHNGVNIRNLTTKSGGSNSTKVGLNVESTGSWGPGTTNQPNIGINVQVSGADDNYPAIFNGGNVGIGTSSPEQSLDLIGYARIGAGAGAANEGLLLYTPSPGLSIIRAGGRATSEFRLDQSNNAPMTFRANGSERMRIDEDGDVGIGTTNPTRTLQVNSNTAGAYATYVQQGSGTGNGLQIYANTASNVQTVLNASSNTTGLIVGGGGYVGMGTTNLNSALNVKDVVTNSTGEEGAFINIQNDLGTSGSLSGVRFKVNTIDTDQRHNAGIFYEFNSSSGLAGLRFALKTNSTSSNVNVSNTVMSVNESGNVGIGETNPIAKLQVEETGTSYVARFHGGIGSGADGITVRAGPTTPTTGTFFMLFQGGASFISQGSIRATGAGGVQYNTTSDRRLKQNIEDLNNALEKVMQIRPRTYEFKAAPGNKEDGFIAQELKMIYPTVVSGEEDGNVNDEPMMVDYSKLTPLLTKAIQEQQEIIEKQNQEIEELKALISKMETSDSATQAQLDVMKAQIDKLTQILTAEANKGNE